VDKRFVSYLKREVSVSCACVEEEGARLTADILLAATERALAATTIAEQTTSATVGLRSNFAGHNERIELFLKCVVLKTDKVSPEVPRIIMEEQRAKDVKARRADSTRRAVLAFFWCPASGASNSLNSEVKPGLKAAIVS